LKRECRKRPAAATAGAIKAACIAAKAAGTASKAKAAGKAKVAAADAEAAAEASGAAAEAPEAEAPQTPPAKQRRKAVEGAAEFVKGMGLPP